MAESPNLQNTAAQFFRRCLAARVSDVSLYASSLSDAAIVHTFEGVLERDPMDLGLEAVGLAQSDAAGKSGAVRFEIIACREAGQQWGRQVLVIDGGAGSFDTDDVTIKGLMVEMIRDRRDMTRMTLSYNESLFDRMQQQNDMMAQQIVRADEIRLKMFEVLENLTTEKHRRDLETRRAAHNERSRERMVESFVPLVPALMNKFVGHTSGKPAELSAAPAAAPTDPVSLFVKSITQEQVGKIFPLLSPSQQGALVELSEAAEGKRPLVFGPEMITSLVKSLDEKQVEKILEVLDDSQRTVFFDLAMKVSRDEEKEKAELEARAKDIEKTTGGDILADDAVTP